ncbi:hypothetical protein MN116_003219 [Schistosoma mekongi]|uniref:Transmembrane protein n=1 Tax=Schistosoma mekongi TaxID=38744 RepID=A0AAE2D756_SCHME|nr:hypothetical protein MN116_003219 [Schistosoma mekongi]
MENSDSESSLEQNSLASVINLFEQPYRSTVPTLHVINDVHSLTSSSNHSFNDTSNLTKHFSQSTDELELLSFVDNSFGQSFSPKNSDLICSQHLIPYYHRYIDRNKQSSSIQTLPKLSESFLSSQTSSVELNVLTNPSTVFPINVITNLHIPQYRPLPAHKLGIISEDLSSTFSVLNLTLKQQHESVFLQVSSSASTTLLPSSKSLSSGTTSFVSLSSVINTSLENQVVNTVNNRDNSLVQSYDRSSMRLMLTDYSLYNQQIYDYNKCSGEGSSALTCRSINNSEPSTSKVSHPGGDSGISNTSPDTYSLSEPGMVASASPYPFDNVESCNEYQEQRNFNVISQTIRNNPSYYSDNDKRDNKSRHKVEQYSIHNQHLYTPGYKVERNACISNISTNYSKIKQSHNENPHDIKQMFENNLCKFNEITSTFSLSTSSSSPSPAKNLSSLSSTSSSRSSSSSSSSSSSTPTNSSKSELFAVTLNRKLRNNLSGDDSTVYQQDTVHERRIKNKQSIATSFSLVSKRKCPCKEDSASDNTFCQTQHKYANNLIKIIYGILLTTVGFLLVCIQFNGKKTESLVFEVFLNFLLIGLFCHFLSFYATTYYKICCSYCNCCSVDSNLSSNQKHLYYFPYHKSRITDQLFSHNWNHEEVYRKRMNQTLNFENRQINIRHQRLDLIPLRDKNLISQSDNLQYHQLVTISNSVSLKPQLQNRKQKRRITSNFTHEDCYRILSKCEYIIQGFFCVGSIIIVMYYGNKFIKSFPHSSNLDMWYSLNHIYFKKSNTNQLVINSPTNTDNLFGHKNKYFLEKDNSIFKENNISNQHTLITNVSIISSNIPYIINKSSSDSIIFNYTIFNNQTNITSYNLSKVADFKQITYTNYLQLINNALWILLTVMQIPVMIRLRKLSLISKLKEFPYLVDTPVLYLNSSK